MATVIGTDKGELLKVNRGDSVTALGGNDTINLMTADPYYSNTAPTPFGVIDGGNGTDTLVLKAPKTDDWSYVFTELRSVEKLNFTNALDYTAEAAFLVTVPLSATGTVAAGAALAITGSAGSNAVAYYVTGGMGSASTIALPDLSITGFDLSKPLESAFVLDSVQLVAGDSSNYVLKASDVIGNLGIQQNLYGNAGNDRLMGSVGTDILSGGPGSDKMYGNDGNDFFRLSTASAPLAGDLFDGGAGIDSLYVTGPNRSVAFAGTLVSIEGIWFGSNCTLTMTADQMKMLPATLSLRGVSAATLSITDANVFGAAKFTFSPFSPPPKLAISGTAGADNITGSSANDVLHGSGGNDSLFGGLGQDTLYGDAGTDALTGGQNADKFVFDTGTGAVLRDTIVDFNSAEGDRIVLTQTGFAAVHQTGGVLNAAEFYAVAGAKAHDADDRIIYNTTTGTLSYDTDGFGGQAAVVFATLKGIPALAATDIIVV